MQIQNQKVSILPHAVSTIMMLRVTVLKNVVPSEKESGKNDSCKAIVVHNSIIQTLLRIIFHQIMMCTLVAKM